MKKTVFQGSAVALITPMNDDFSINYDELARLIDFHLAHQTDAIVAAGTTGESATLTDEEHLKVIAFCVKQVKGRIPVIAGAGSNNTARAVFLSQQAKACGADALLHVTPYYNKASQKGLYLHFKACAEATDLPVLLYNVPSRTGVNILPETYRRLSEIPNIVAVKEASGNFSQMAKIASLCGEELPSTPATTIRSPPLWRLARRASFPCWQTLCRSRPTRFAKAILRGTLPAATRFSCIIWS